MGTGGVDVFETLRSRKFLALLAIALLVTYVLPFPFIHGFLRDYSRVREIRERMVKEDEAITCHDVFDADPSFFGSHGMKCSDEYYRPGERTVTVDGFWVYEDTYHEYLRAKRNLREELPAFVIFVIFAFLSFLGFSYAMVDLAVGLAGENGRRLKEVLLSGLRAIPALVAAEILVFIVLVLVLILLAIPMAIFGPLGSFMAGLIAAPAFALVVPAYYFTKEIGLIGEIWRVARNNPGGYFTLGLGLAVLDTLMVFQYHTYLGIGTLFLMLIIGGPRYLLNSLGALWVYLDTPPKNQGEK
ncbi:hypothetical protein [Thermococcus barossii]|uniref:Uncharacterized protein n=1 Tax=Thermococcus barossii TaxID=54077 RepID=A0A2Z2MQV3_9EURY|nr:hypothetical protein [Thermococcus barossii]ASJ04278.1 hypothetical protein A3L01_02460 [Thermococcus barossii]